MLKPFRNSDLLPISEAYRRMYVSEALTIPSNMDDRVEIELRKVLPQNYEHADRIIRWYRNDRKTKSDSELISTYIRNIGNIIDLLKTYSSYIDKLKKLKMVGRKIELPTQNGGTMGFDPVKDFDKIRSLDGAHALIQRMGDIIHSDTTIDVDLERFAFTDDDRRRIRIFDFSEHVVVWATQDYATTNKFVYHLWQNAKTLGRGDVYGDKSEQTPYCTHSKEHWDNYSTGDDYTQYWFLRKLDGVKYSRGDLNDEVVVDTFVRMKGMGPKLLIAMNDSDDDFLDDEDDSIDDVEEIRALPFGSEVERLNNSVLKVIFEQQKLEFDKYIRSGRNFESIDFKKFKKHLTEYVVPDGVTSIGYGAFSGCSSLMNVTIPDSVTSIGSYAFSGCSGLTNVTIGNGVTSISEGMFYNCSGLTDVTIPDSVKSIEYCAFSGCSGLTSVTIPDSVTSIGRYAFSGCSGLTSVTIPDSVTSIGYSAFSGCSGLTNVTIGNGVTSIGSSAFYGCSGLSSVTIPDSVTSIGRYAFSGCSGLTSVTIPDSVTSIGYSAFRGCSSLMRVTIPDSVTSIGNWAFEGCRGLVSVTIPDSVTSIGNEAFYGCSSLRTINAPERIHRIILLQIRGW